MKFYGMMTSVAGIALFSLALQAQTTVYLPPVGAAACDVTAATSASPSVVTVARCNKPLTNGGYVAVIGAGDPVSGSGVQSGFELLGLRKITSISGNTITLTDLSNIALSAASFVCPAVGSYRIDRGIVPNAGCARIVQLQTSSLKGHPR